MAQVPKYETGVDYVPRTSIAIVHQGERIIPASQNAGSRSPVVGVDMPSLNVTFNHHGNLTMGQIKENAYIFARELQKIIRDNPSLRFT